MPNSESLACTQADTFWVGWLETWYPDGTSIQWYTREWKFKGAFQVAKKRKKKKGGKC